MEGVVPKFHLLFAAQDYGIMQIDHRTGILKADVGRSFFRFVGPSLVRSFVRSVGRSVVRSVVRSCSK